MARLQRGSRFRPGGTTSTSGTGTNLPDPVTVAHGGTGATTLTGALVGNGTSAVTAGTLSVANGGTGAATLTGALVGNGTSAVTAGTLSVANGGTGATTLTSGALLKGAGSSAIAAADLTGDVTTSGALATTIAAASVTLAKQANLAANTIIGNNTGSSATPLALTRAQVWALLSANATADVDMNANKITNLADASAAGDAWTFTNQRKNWATLTSDMALTSQNYPLILASAGSALATAGTVYAIKVWAPVGTITTINFYLNSAGSGLTTGQCFAALYDSSKNQVGSTSSDLSATSFVGAQGIRSVTVGSWSNSTAQYAYVALMFNGSGGPNIMRLNNTQSQNQTLSTANSAFASADTGRTTTMPNPLGSFTAINVGYWVALS